MSQTVVTRLNMEGYVFRSFYLVTYIDIKRKMKIHAMFLIVKVTRFSWNVSAICFITNGAPMTP